MTRPMSFAAAGLMLALLSLPASAQLGGDQSALIEPNVAADSQMTRLGLGAGAIQSIKDARPILSIVSFDSLLGAAGMNRTQRATMLQQAFVHVDVNRGSDAELMLVPGMNAARMSALKAGRPYATFDAFRTAMGKSGPAAEIAALERYLFIPIELNTFTEPLMDTFAPIGVGTRRWKREFAEYRPWTSMDQFRREIGKYVRGNPKELTRLERYVIIK